LGQAAAPFAARLRRLLWEAGDRKWYLLKTLQVIDDPAELRAELFARLRSPRWEERAEAITSLSLLNAQPAGVLESALGMLSDGDVRVRGRALEAIARLGPYGHTDHEDQERALEAIAHLGPQGHADALAVVRELFRGGGLCKEA